MLAAALRRRPEEGAVDDGEQVAGGEQPGEGHHERGHEVAALEGAEDQVPLAQEPPDGWQPGEPERRDRERDHRDRHAAADPVEFADVVEVEVDVQRPGAEEQRDLQHPVVDDVQQRPFERRLG